MKLTVPNYNDMIMLQSCDCVFGFRIDEWRIDLHGNLQKELESRGVRNINLHCDIIYM